MEGSRFLHFPESGVKTQNCRSDPAHAAPDGKLLAEPHHVGQIPLVALLSTEKGKGSRLRPETRVLSSTRSL